MSKRQAFLMTGEERVLTVQLLTDGPQTFSAFGTRVRIRSDFPVLVQLDGRRVGNTGPPAFNPNILVDLTEPDEPDTPQIRVLTVDLPAAWGGAATEADAHGRHGQCSIQVLGHGLHAMEEDVNLWPSHCYAINESVALGITGESAALTSNWDVGVAGGAKSPTEIFVRSITAAMTDVIGAAAVPVDGYVWKVELRANNLPVNDAETFVVVGESSGRTDAAAGRSIWTATVNQRIQLKSTRSAFGGETPVLELFAARENNSGAAAFVQVWVNAQVRFGGDADL